MTSGARKFVLAAALFGVLAGAACRYDPARANREHLAKGDAYARAGKYPEAAIEYRNAIKDAPASVESHAKLADAAARARDPRTALLEYLRIADLSPADAAAQVRAGSVDLLAGRYDAARERAEAALQNAPADPAAHLVLGEALAGLHDASKSVTTLAEATRLAPTAPEVHIALGSAYWATGRKSDAEAELTRAVDVAPSSVSAHRALGLFLMATGRPAAAEPHWRVVARAPDGDPFALVDYYLAINRDADAERELNTLGQANTGKSARAFLLQGRLLAAKKQNDEARRALEQAERLDPADPSAGTMIGMLLEADGKRTDAQAQYERILKQFPSDGVAANNLAGLYVDSGRMDEALQLALGAERQLPRLAAVHDTVGWIYVRRNEALRAVTPLGEAARLQPKNPTYRYHLAVAYSKVGSAADAREQLQLALKAPEAFADCSNASALAAQLH